MTVARREDPTAQIRTPAQSGALIMCAIHHNISSRVSWKKVDQLYVVHFKFHLISSDTKLPKEG